MSTPPAEHHAIVIVGGGTAGITTAARLIRAGQHDIAIIEPSNQHYYQPLFTVVGGGRAPQSAHRAAGSRRNAQRRALDPRARHSRRPGRPDRHHRTRPRRRLRLPHRGARDPARLRQGPRPDRDPRRERGVEQLPVRPHPAHLGIHPGPARRHRDLHHARRADQVRGRPAEDRLPGRRLVAQPARPGQDPDHPGAAHRGHVQPARLGQGAGRHRRRLRHRGPQGIPAHRGGRRGQTGRHRRHQGGHEGNHRLRPAARRAAAERPRLAQAEPAGRPRRPGYVSADKHTLVHPRWPNVFTLGDAANLPDLKDRSRDPQAGSGRWWPT